MIDVESAAALRYGIPCIPESRALDTIVEEILRWDRLPDRGCGVEPGTPVEPTRWGAYPMGIGSCLITACDSWGVSAGLSYTKEDPLICVDLSLRGVRLSGVEVAVYYPRDITRRLRHGFFQAWGAARAVVEALSSET